MITPSLTDEINIYVDKLLKATTTRSVVRQKVIHDPILGTNLFESHEIALIDSPFCQRLRRISQTDVASLVFPSANHNRLEHSLGVATIAGRIIDNLYPKLEIKRHNRLFNAATKIAVRTAALLHDIGQGPFSHLSDDIIKELPEVIEYRKAHPGIFAEHKPHEMLSYLIAKDSSFKKYFNEEIVSKYDTTKDLANELDIEEIADMIVAGRKGKKDFWQADIINGPFDADKLDYLQRDAYFSGLKIGIDLDRLLHSIWLDESNKRLQLKILSSGAITLEQIMFGKILLYHTMYQHHKVLAAECVIKGIFELLEDNPRYTINGKRLDKATDFLEVSEGELISPHNKADELKDHIERFLYRNLFKRALVISADTVEGPDTSIGYSRFKDLAESPKDLKNLRKKLVSALNNKYPLHEIWIVLPRTPTFSDEAIGAKIKDPGGTERSLRDPFRVDEWLTSYWSNKWTGYVFCRADKKIRDEVGKKAADLLYDEYGIMFKSSAFDQAKIR
jgi:uncharacterized protein